jgi:hypothetical protein
MSWTEKRSVQEHRNAFEADGFVFCPVASEAFFDNLTVEQEFMTGVDTDKVRPMHSVSVS